MKSEPALTAYLENPNPQTRDALVIAHWHLCLRGARKFYRTGVDRSDLIQISAIGLLKAVDGYKPELRTPFEAYAWLLVVGELMHYVRDHERIMRIPRALRALEKRYAQTNDVLTVQLGRKPNPQEMAAELNVEEAMIDQIRLLRRGGAVVSLESCTGSPTGELAARPSGLSMEERLSLAFAIEELGERERVAVLGSFAAGLSQAEIGERLGLSQSQVSKLIKRALSKMHAQVA
jgi:RNA polymerase sigma-B factor